MNVCKSGSPARSGVQVEAFQHRFGCSGASRADARSANYWRLPPSVQQIADVIGVEKALELVGKLPRCIPRSGTGQGVRVMLYVPQTLSADHALVRMIGWHSAAALVEAFGGEVLKPGSCRDIYRAFRDRSIVELAADGMPLDHLAEIMGVGLRHVKNVLRGEMENAPVEVA